MLIYWILFAFPAIAALLCAHSSSKRLGFALWSFAGFVTLIFGLRYVVGVDWGNYLDQYDLATSSTCWDAMLTNDSGYGLLNWAAGQMGCGIWLVNLVCAAIYAYGILMFCAEIPNRWLALTVVMPFMGIVVGMSYTRQSAALGFVFLAIVALNKEKMLRFAFLIIAAALFHRTAAVLFPLGGLFYAPNRAWRWFWISAGSVLGYYVFLHENKAGLVDTYWNQQMVSGGTVPRILMNTVAAASILLLRNYYDVDLRVRKFWNLYALSAIPFLVAIIALPPLTAIDRLALYWMPLQIYAFANLPQALRKVGLMGFTNVAVVCCYAVVQFVWFNYGNFSWAWLPYRFYPFEVIFHRLDY